MNAVRSGIKHGNGEAIFIGTPMTAVQSRIKDENGGAIFIGKSGSGVLLPGRKDIVPFHKDEPVFSCIGLCILL